MNYWREYLTAFIILASIIVLVEFSISQQAPIDTQNVVVENPEPHREVENPFNALSVSANYVLVQDLVTDTVIYDKDADDIAPLASLIKILTALAALEQFPNAPMYVSDTAVAQVGDSGLRVGETWNTNDLVRMMFIASSNDAAYAVAMHQEPSTYPLAYLRSMHGIAARVGADSLYTFSPSGLDYEDDSASAFGSAQDIMRLMDYGLERYPEIFHESVRIHEQIGGSVDLANTNIALSSIPNIVFSKTGYTDTAGGNLAFVFELAPGYPIGVVIMDSTFEGRFTDAKRIVRTVLEYYALVYQGAILSPASR